MRLEVEVEVEDRETVVTVIDGRDVRRWEAKYEKSFISEDLSYTILTILAFFSLKRTGLDDGLTLAKFEALCTGVTTVGGDEGEDPT